MLTRISIPSPNYSSRYGNKVRLIVLHTSEGAQTYQSLGSFFANPANEVSSQVGIDDTPNTIGEYVGRPMAAWTASGANVCATQAEFCTPSGAAANWTTEIWMNQHHQMLANAAQWIAEEAAHFSIPIVKLTPSQAQGDYLGVCQHSDLGSWGGGHYDCGPGFPIDYVLSLAVGNPPLEGDNVTSYFVNNQHHVYRDNGDGTVTHWWMDLGSRPPSWAKETLR